MEIPKKDIPIVSSDEVSLDRKVFNLLLGKRWRDACENLASSQKGIWPVTIDQARDLLVKHYLSRCPHLKKDLVSVQCSFCGERDFRFYHNLESCIICYGRVYRCVE